MITIEAISVHLEDNNNKVMIYNNSKNIDKLISNILDDSL